MKKSQIMRRDKTKTQGFNITFSLNPVLRTVIIFCCLLSFYTASANRVEMVINHRYLNIPVGYQARMRLIQLEVKDDMKREFPVHIAEDSIGYWIFIDVSD